MLFKNKSILVYDIETDSLDLNTAKMKFFGAYSYSHDKNYFYKYPEDRKEIIHLLNEHKVLVGFNTKEFDNPIIELNLALEDNIFEYKVLVDLLEISAPKSGKNYGIHRKNRLAMMGIKLKNFTLKKIIEELKLDKEIGTKGDIDYRIFQKDTWTREEILEIEKYLQQDIDLTKKLFEWYEEQFSPLKKLLPKKAQDNFLYLKSSLASLAYNIICNKAGLQVDFGEKIVNEESFEGGHHIESIKDLVTGNIIEVDFTSAYPHAIMMGNLCSPVPLEAEGWKDEYYDLKGKYNNKEQGKIELALKDIFMERLKAKREGDKPKDKSYKIVINSFYGTLGNPVFKSIYNRNSAADCTSIVRTWMKKLAKSLKNSGYECLYGFTDSIFILLPPELTKTELMDEINSFLEEAMSHLPFPMPETFQMGIEEEIKMIWFVQKNCYLFVTQKDEIKYKSTLLNTNTPKAVMKLFEEYMKPIIISTLSVPFTKEELERQLKIIIEKNFEMGAQEYKVTKTEDYKVKTSIQYQISEKYGEGRHLLIPNKKGIGIGLAKSTKKKIGVRYCTVEQYKENNLTLDDIELNHLMSHLKPFYERNEPKKEEKRK